MEWGTRNAYRIVVKTSLGEQHFGDLEVNGTITLKFILRK
jgi:hypothetical protein